MSIRDWKGVMNRFTIELEGRLEILFKGLFLTGYSE
jgi:hypothetical protein